MKKFIFVYIGTFCILFTCYGKGIRLQTYYKKNNDTDWEYNSASIVVDCLGADEAMNIVSKLKEVIELERYYKVKGRKAIVLMQSPNKKTPYFWIQVGFSTSY